LVLLLAFNSQDEVRHNVEKSIAYRLFYEEVKKACLRGFSKQLENWVSEKLETKIKGIDVKKYARRIFKILGYQAPMALIINNLSCLWQSSLCKRVWSNSPLRVYKKIVLWYQQKGACTFFQIVDEEQRMLDRYQPPTKNIATPL
jgi:hypothetical protein